MKTMMLSSLLTLLFALFTTNGLQAQTCNPTNCSIEQCMKMFKAKAAAMVGVDAPKTAKATTVSQTNSSKAACCAMMANCDFPKCLVTGCAPKTAQAKNSCSKGKAVAVTDEKVLVKIASKE